MIKYRNPPFAPLERPNWREFTRCCHFAATLLPLLLANRFLGFSPKKQIRPSRSLKRIDAIEISPKLVALEIRAD